LKVVLYGATGKAGSVILNELVDRGHVVIAAARTPEKVPTVKNVTAVQDHLSNAAKTASVVKTGDTVISAYGPPLDDTSASSHK
jgi:putative NADH-flavin reductase